MIIIRLFIFGNYINRSLYDLERMKSFIILIIFRFHFFFLEDKGGSHFLFTLLDVVKFISLHRVAINL